MTRRALRGVLAAALAGWAGSVAVITLGPTGWTPPLTWSGFLCVGCGYRATADIILNVVLFLPGGIVLAALWGRRPALLSCAALTAVIEFVQVGIPGRTPDLQDLLFNALGAALGALLVTRDSLPPLRRVVIAGAVLAWVLPAALLVPVPTRADLWGQWTPRLGGFEKYAGRVLDARVAGAFVPPVLVRDGEGLREGLASRAPIGILLQVGPPPRALAPIFSIFDGEQVENLMVAAIGEDLIVRVRGPAHILRLDQADARWHGALKGIEAGDTLHLVIDRGRASTCIRTDARERCGLAPSLGRGWAFLMNPEGAPAVARALMDVAWSVLLGLALGLAVGRPRAAGAAGVALALVGLAVAAGSPDVRPDVVHAATLACGAALGPHLRVPLGGALGALRREATRSGRGRGGGTRGGEL